MATNGSPSDSRPGIQSKLKDIFYSKGYYNKVNKTEQRIPLFGKGKNLLWIPCLLAVQSVALPCKLASRRRPRPCHFMVGISFPMLRIPLSPSCSPSSGCCTSPRLSPSFTKLKFCCPQIKHFSSVCLTAVAGRLPASTDDCRNKRYFNLRVCRDNDKSGHCDSMTLGGLQICC